MMSISLVTIAKDDKWRWGSSRPRTITGLSQDSLPISTIVVLFVEVLDWVYVRGSGLKVSVGRYGDMRMGNRYGERLCQRSL